MERLYIRPRKLKPSEAAAFGLEESDCLRVLDPMTNRPLPEEGQSVVQSSYWVKRLRDGDVEIVKPAARARTRSSSASEKE